MFFSSVTGYMNFLINACQLRYQTYENILKRKKKPTPCSSK
jgi:hypothetical protein